MDTPRDLYKRMRLNIALNEELGVRIWSFPMRYQPVTLKDRSHVGKNWNRYYLRSFQIMLQATHGVVSGNPSFFVRAYGEDEEGFERLLSFPHAFIFHRDHFENGGGRAELDEYLSLRQRLSESQNRELIHHLSGPAQAAGLRREHYRMLLHDRSVDVLIREALQFHLLDTKDRPDDRNRKALALFPDSGTGFAMPKEDEVVEDAGLFDHEYSLRRDGKGSSNLTN